MPGSSTSPRSPRPASHSQRRRDSRGPTHIDTAHLPARRPQIQNAASTRHTTHYDGPSRSSPSSPTTRRIRGRSTTISSPIPQPESPIDYLLYSRRPPPIPTHSPRHSGSSTPHSATSRTYCPSRWGSHDHTSSSSPTLSRSQTPTGTFDPPPSGGSSPQETRLTSPIQCTSEEPATEAPSVRRPKSRPSLSNLKLWKKGDRKQRVESHAGPSEGIERRSASSSDAPPFPRMTSYNDSAEGRIRPLVHTHFERAGPQPRAVTYSNHGDRAGHGIGSQIDHRSLATSGVRHTFAASPHDPRQSSAYAAEPRTFLSDPSPSSDEDLWWQAREGVRLERELLGRVPNNKEREILARRGRRLREGERI